MDETPVYFDLPGSRTVHPTGEKAVLVKTTGNERSHFTAVLGVCADDPKLEHMLILKERQHQRYSFQLEW